MRDSVGQQLLSIALTLTLSRRRGDFESAISKSLIMKIAAVCVTYLRPRQLGWMIHCFLRQDYPAARRELVILDDAGQYDNQSGPGWRLVSAAAAISHPGRKTQRGRRPGRRRRRSPGRLGRRRSVFALGPVGLGGRLGAGRLVAALAGAPSAGRRQPATAPDRRAVSRRLGLSPRRCSGKPAATRPSTTAKTRPWPGGLSQAGATQADPCCAGLPALLHLLLERRRLAPVRHGQRRLSAAGRGPGEKTPLADRRPAAIDLRILASSADSIPGVFIRECFAMTTIRLIRAVSAPTGRGPGNGQYALQKAPAAVGPRVAEDRRPARPRRNPLVLVLGGPRGGRAVRPDRAAVRRRPQHALRPTAATRAASRRSARSATRPVAGCCSPNRRGTAADRAASRSGQPGADGALAVSDRSAARRPAAAAVRPADLREVGRRRGDGGAACSGPGRGTPASATAAIAASSLGLARRSRCCLYFSDDDRGPLALAEILLAGCPAVGVPRGAPFVEPGRTGVLLERLDSQSCLEAVAGCRQLDRGRSARRPRSSSTPGGLSASSPTRWSRWEGEDAAGVWCRRCEHRCWMPISVMSRFPACPVYPLPFSRFVFPLHFPAPAECSLGRDGQRSNVRQVRQSTACFQNVRRCSPCRVLPRARYPSWPP